jgi:hypothetical protein
MIAEVQRASLIVLLAVMPAVARADPASDAMHEYFEGEQTGSYVLAGMGTAGIVGGALLLRSDSPRAQGAGYSFLAMGGLHVAAGAFIYAVSARRIDKFTDQIAQDRSTWIAEESKRMSSVSTQLTALKIAELVVVAGGFALAGIGHRYDRPRLVGAGLALSLEMSATFVFDIFASRRAHMYRDSLSTLQPRATLEPSSGAFSLTWTASW